MSAGPERLWIWAVVLAAIALLGAACTNPPDNGDNGDADGNGAGGNAVGGGVRVDALPASFEIAGAGPTLPGGPPGATMADFAAVVGQTPDDPRFLEVAFYEFERAADFAAAEPFVGLAADQDGVPLPAAGVNFAFVPLGDGPELTRRQSLELLDEGPFPDSTIRGAMNQRQFAVGAARVLQGRDIDALLPLVASESWADDGALAQGMRVLVDQPLPDGAVVELRSGRGSVLVELREGVPRNWFDYVTWDDGFHPALPVVEPGAHVSVRNPDNFGPNGEALNPARTAVWTDDERLVLITHPELPDPVITAVYNAFRGASTADLLALADEHGPLSDVGGAPAAAGPGPPPQVAPPPSEATIDELQAFVEAARERSAGEDLPYEFVEEISVPGGGNLFVSARLWAVLDALGLIGPGQDLAGANQARIEALRGTPGTVVLQPTTALTETVIVHEMTHSIDDPVLQEGGGGGGSLELLSPAQALTEGNANRVAAEYVATLDDDRRDEVAPFPGIFLDPDRRLSLAVRRALEFPYVDGLPFAQAIADAGGEAAIDAALVSPPVSTEQILFPDAYFAGDEPVAADNPDVPQGAFIEDEGVLGAFLLVLAVEGDGSELIDGRPAVEGWSGDRYVLYTTSDNRTCLDANIEMDTNDAANRLAAALTGDNQSAVAFDSGVRLSACS